ncbi:ATP phosphoribosyltransferase regulatory subunit [Hydrogenophaga sp. OTU3427]|uniref:ATP phosphoribosyltransferase regulatory subunit n=1 Tax=Hydrogenophaga sp. OTU3427 TaxID=3043856 RepID=UPI00313F239E
MSAWVLPDQIADVLPSEARHIEELRRSLLDTASGYGYELVMPPLLEHLESLLTGTGEALGLQTFKLVDQLSGRSLGVRADSTPQVARIDAHLLNRQGVARLCYCGPVLHTRADRPLATREPLQLGAEIYGHGGLEADLEAMELAQACVLAAGLRHLTLDMADVRVIDSVLAGVPLGTEQTHLIHAALARKDAAELNSLSRDLPADVRSSLLVLPRLYGDVSVLAEARRVLRPSPLLEQALDGLRWLADHLSGLDVSFDLADLRGYAYYTGVRFSLFARSERQGGAGGTATHAELVRGGRYDEVGAIFGRKRPAVGFSLDLKELVQVSPRRALKAAVRAPWGNQPGLRDAIAALRAAGETVVCALPGHDHEVDEFHCDRVLTQRDGGWSVQPV